MISGHDREKNVPSSPHCSLTVNIIKAPTYGSVTSSAGFRLSSMQQYSGTYTSASHFAVESQVHRVLRCQVWPVSDTHTHTHTGTHVIYDELRVGVLGVSVWSSKINGSHRSRNGMMEGGGGGVKHTGLQRAHVNIRSCGEERVGEVGEGPSQKSL